MGKSDHRDDDTWVVVELTKAGELKVSEGAIEAILRDLLKAGDQYPVFVPSATYKVAGNTTVLNLMQGYAFVKSGLPETQYFRIERDNPYVKKILTTRSAVGMRVLNTVTNDSIMDLRKKLSEHVSSDIITDSKVVVSTGLLSNLEGEVVDVGEELAFVLFKLRSIDIMASLPRAFLSPSSLEA